MLRTQLSTILDDHSWYTIARKLCTTIKAGNKTTRVELGLRTCDQATVILKPRTSIADGCPVPENEREDQKADHLTASLAAPIRRRLN